MNRTGDPSVEVLLARIAALQAENHQLADRVVKLEEELALARLHRFAPRSEKHVDRLFNEAEQAADEDDTGSDTDNIAELPDTGLPPVESTTGKKRGRRPLPANLQRERVEYDLPDDQKACPCCRGQMHRMGEAVTEQLHIEVKAKVLQNVRFKYACRHCDRTGINAPVVTAPMPTQPLPGSVATASTLAFALVHKYVDGTPLYRLAQAFERAGGGPPEQALRFFEQIYRVERQARDEKPDRGETPDQCIRRFRQQHSIPVLNALKEWLDQIAPKVLPDSKLGDAISYTRNQWEYLTRYAEDGRMPIDNNLLERDIRIFATGRKSWLFSDTVEGARASAVVYSLMLTCRASRVEPLAWLRHVLTELPQRAGDADITDLLPFNFPKTATA
ncbi:transposase [Bradyrhizobium sp. JR4.1]|uniref:IS66 family transposase n=1 Tax=Bradyrhizobium sp. JR4.1 TaxID=3156372 RepID=UPI0033987924